jgi:GDP-L-fucose synthase
VSSVKGLVGSEVLKVLQEKGYNNIITKTKQELDLRKQSDVETFFIDEKPEYVIMSAAKVGGILANSTYPAEFIYDNIMIQNNIIHSSYLNNVKKLIFLGSSCIYPKLCSQPIKEEYLLTDSLEPTNEAYAIAKIAGIKMCEYYNKQYGTNYISVMPTNLYGSLHDNYDLQNSHVLPAMLKKIHDAKVNNNPEVILWGTGNPLREFLHVTDLANAICFLLENYNKSEFLNVGTGYEISIKKLAELIKNIIGYEGKITFDNTKPNGTPRKLIDSTKINRLGWKAKISLEDGITKIYSELIKNHKLFQL